MTAKPTIQPFFDEATYTVTYLVCDPETKRAAVIDSVLDFDPKSGRTSTRSAEAVLKSAADQGLTIDWILETHAHADHLSAAVFLKEKTGANVAIGEHIADVQKVFRPVFNAKDVAGDGAPFDRLLTDGEHFTIGDLDVEVMHTPGHTPGLHQLPYRRQCLCRRYAVHAGLRHGAGGFPGRRCAHALPLDQEAAVAAARNDAVDVPRLQAPGPRYVCLEDHRGRRARQECPCA